MNYPTPDGSGPIEIYTTEEGRRRLEKEWAKKGGKRGDVVCCYKEDNAEQCEATMTLGMGSLCTMRASLTD